MSLLRALGIAVLATSPTFAHAQEPEPTISNVERILVTAQKRQQTIHQVPIALSTLWPKRLEHLGIFDLIDLSAYTPGFSTGQFNVGQPQFYIRGIGSNEDGAGGDNAVVITADGVPINRSTGSLFDFFDIERIEVLRGPQGTLYGRNATGGVVNVISRKPLPDADNLIRLALGSDGIREGRGYYNFTFERVPDLFSSLSIFHRQRDGVVSSHYGPEQSDVNDSGVKLQFYRDIDDFSHWHLISELSRVRRAGPGRHAVGGLIGNSIDTAPPLDSNHPYINLSPFYGFQDRDGANLTALYQQQSSRGLFKSISGYRNTKLSSQIDQFGISEQEGLLQEVFGTGLAGTNDVEETDWQLTQELQLSQTKSDWFWLLGMFLMHDDTDRTESFHYINPSFSFQQNKTNNIAVFGETMLKFSNEFSLTAGGRFSYEEKQIEQSAIGGTLIVTQDYDISAEHSWEKFTPKLLVSYAPSEAYNHYFSVSSGFKSGGFQGQAPSAFAASRPFEEEDVVSYELGSKWYVQGASSWVHAAAFYMEYENMQVLQLVNNPNDPSGVGYLVTENAANAVSQGIELEWQLTLNDAWQIRGNYAYLDAKFKDYESTQGNFKGNRLRNAPEHSAALSLNYQYENSPGNLWQLTYSHSYQDIRYQEPANIENTAISSYQLGHLHMTYQALYSPWQFGFWINNIWDKTYYVHGFPVLGSGLLTPGPKRNMGVKIDIQF